MNYIIMWIWKIIWWIFLTWQLPQNVVGWLMSIGKTPAHILPGGVIVYVMESEWPGISLGRYMFISKTAHHGTLRHLYGHFIQSVKLGPLYIPVILIPALLGVLLFKQGYLMMYTETWANNEVKRR